MRRLGAKYGEWQKMRMAKKMRMGDKMAFLNGTEEGKFLRRKWTPAWFTSHVAGGGVNPFCDYS